MLYSSARNERLFLCGSFVTNLGKGVQIIATAFFVMETSKSIAAVGLLFLFLAIPEALVSLFVGRALDGRNLQSIAVATDLARGLVTLLVPMCIVLESSGAWLVFALNFLIALADAVAAPSANTLMLRVVVPGGESRLSGWYETATQAGNVLSVAIGGFVVDAVGSAPVLVFSGLAYFAAAALYWSMRPCMDVSMGHTMAPGPSEQPLPRTAAVAPRSKVPRAQNATGLWAVVSSPGVVAPALMFALGKCMITFTNALIVPLFTQHFPGSMGAVGMADALAAVGMIAAGLSCQGLLRRVGGARLMLLGFAGAGIFAMATPSFGQVWAALCIGLLSWSLGYGRIAMRHELMLHVPRGLIGRTFGSLNGVGLLCAALGSVGITKYAERAGFQAAYMAYGACVLAAVAAAYLVTGPLKARSEWRQRQDSNLRPLL